MAEYKVNLRLELYVDADTEEGAREAAALMAFDDIEPEVGLMMITRVEAVDHENSGVTR